MSHQRRRHLIVTCPFAHVFLKDTISAFSGAGATPVAQQWPRQPAVLFEARWVHDVIAPAGPIFPVAATCVVMQDLNPQNSQEAETRRQWRTWIITQGIAEHGTAVNWQTYRQCDATSAALAGGWANSSET